MSADHPPGALRVLLEDLWRRAEHFTDAGPFAEQAMLELRSFAERGPEERLQIAYLIGDAEHLGVINGVDLPPDVKVVVPTDVDHGDLVLVVRQARWA